MMDFSIRKNVVWGLTPEWASHAIKAGSAITAIALTALAYFNPEKAIFAAFTSVLLYGRWFNFPKMSEGEARFFFVLETGYRAIFAAVMIRDALHSFPLVAAGVAGMILLKTKVFPKLSPTLSHTGSVIHAFVIGSGFASLGIFCLFESKLPLFNSGFFWFSSIIILTGIINFHNGSNSVSKAVGQIFKQRHDKTYNERLEELRKQLTKFLDELKNDNDLSNKDHHLRELKKIFGFLPSLKIKHKQELIIDLMKSMRIVPDLMTAKEFISKWPQEAFTEDLFQLIVSLSKDIQLHNTDVIAYLLNQLTDKNEIKKYIDDGGMDVLGFSFLKKLKELGETPSQGFIKVVFNDGDINGFDDYLLMLSWVEKGIDFDQIINNLVNYLYEIVETGSPLPEEISTSMSEEALLLKRRVFLHVLSEASSSIDIVLQNFNENVNNLSHQINTLNLRYGTSYIMENPNNFFPESYKKVKEMIDNNLQILNQVGQGDVEELLDAYFETVQKISIKTKNVLSLESFILSIPKQALKTLQKRYTAFNQAIKKMDEVINQIDDLNKQLKDPKKLNEKAIQQVLKTYENIKNIRASISKDKSIWIKEDSWNLRPEWIEWFSDCDDTMNLIKSYERMQNKADQSFKLFDEFLSNHANTLATWQQEQKYEHLPETYSFYTYIMSKRQPIAFLGASGVENYKNLCAMLRTQFSIDENILDDEDLFQHKLSEIGLRTGKDFDKLGIAQNKSDKELIYALKSYIVKNKIDKKLIAANTFLEVWCGKDWQQNQEFRTALKITAEDDITQALSKIGIKTHRDLMTSGCLPTDQDLIEMYTEASSSDDPTQFAHLYLKRVTTYLNDYMTKMVSKKVVSHHSSFLSTLRSLADRISQVAFFCFTESISFLPIVLGPLPHVIIGFVGGVAIGIVLALFKRSHTPILFESLLPSLLAGRDDQSPTVTQRFQQVGIIERIALIRNQCLKAWVYVLGAKLVGGLQGVALGTRVFFSLASYFELNLKLKHNEKSKPLHEKIGKEFRRDFPDINIILNPVS